MAKIERAAFVALNPGVLSSHRIQLKALAREMRSAVILESVFV